MIEYVAPVAVTSPCVGICIMDDATSRCEGCGRTLDEIAGWLTMTPAERGRIMAALPTQASRCGTRDEEP